MLVLYDIIKGSSMELQLLFEHFNRVFCPWYQELDLGESNYFVTGVFSDLCFLEDLAIQNLSWGFEFGWILTFLGNKFNVKSNKNIY